MTDVGLKVRPQLRPGLDCEESVAISDVRIFCGMIANHSGNHRYWKHDETNLHIEWGGIPKFKQENRRRGFDTQDSQVRREREEARAEHFAAHSRRPGGA